MSWVEWIGLISGVLAIGGATIALVKRYLIPYLRKQIYEPLDHLQPVKKDVLEYKDVQNAIALLTEMICPKKPDVVLGVDRGGAIVGGILAKHFRIPIRLLYCMESDKGFCSDFDNKEVDKKVVVLVDDASRSGRSIEKAIGYVKTRFKPRSLIVTVILLTKTEYRGHSEITPSKLVDCFAYFTARTDIKLPWDVGE